MCGIAAIVKVRAEEQPGPLRNLVASMVQAQRHRGPDHRALWFDRCVALGHARLRVVDLSARADQPFFLKSGRGVLTYNGELYNADDLRAQLAKAGVVFGGNSDTEVLYRALELWPVADVLRRIKGMFAFVYYDRKRKRVIAARDRLGIKPLLIARADRHIVLASEMKGILGSGCIRPEVDPEAVVQVGRFNHLLGQRTSIAGVHRLAPGHCWTWDLKTNRVISETEFARVRFRPSDPSTTFEQRASRLDAAFRNAMRRHLEADVPVACLMSGGVDSTGLVAEAKKGTGTELNTYSLVFPGQSFSEHQRIARVRRELGVANQMIPVEHVSLDDYVRFVDHVQMPQLWTTDLALGKLAQGVALAGERVVLSGEGPDELFAGYDAYRLAGARTCLQRMGVLKLLGQLPRSAVRFRGFTWAELDTAMISHFAAVHDLASRNRDGTRARYGFYPDSLAMWSITGDDIFEANLRCRLPRYDEASAADIRAAVQDRGEDLSELQRNLAFELGVRLPNWVLLTADRVSSAHGIELRVPYLDDEFVDVALSLPDSDRIRGVNEKRILKAMHKRRLPRFVTSQHKQPLYTPTTDWVESFFSHRDWGDLWSSKSIADGGLFDEAEAQRCARQVQHRRFASLHDRLRAEWGFLLVLSTLVWRQRAAVHARRLPFEGIDIQGAADEKDAATP